MKRCRIVGRSGSYCQRLKLLRWPSEPVTVVNGVATFPNVVIYTPGSNLRLTASAPSRTSDNSNTFGITSNNDLIFRTRFDACLP